MGKTLLGISASPRKLGNCELFIKEIFKQLGRGMGAAAGAPSRTRHKTLSSLLPVPFRSDEVPSAG